MHLAFVEDANLSAYLLDPNHEDGGPKAKFLMAIGFDLAVPRAVELALLAHANAHDATVLATHYGMKYHVDGALVSPTGRATDRRRPQAWVAHE